MMKAIFLAPILGIFFAVCGQAPTNNAMNNAASPTAAQSAQPSPSPSKTSAEVTVDKTTVWSGAISVINITEKAPVNVVWSNDDADVAKLKDANATLAVDIMNCAGYLGTGKVAFNERKELRFEFASDGIAADAVEKIKACADEQEAEEKFTTSLAFAVAPADAKRKEIKTAKVDSKKLFASLPAEITKQLTANRGDLAKLTDHWADIDGDGEIDLIAVSTMTPSENSIGHIFLRRGGKWEPIGKTGD